MMFMNIAATYTALTTNFGGIATFTDNYRSRPAGMFPAWGHAAGLLVLPAGA
jgi:hypothetical protein